MARTRIPFLASELRAAAWPVSATMFVLLSVGALFTSVQQAMMVPFVAAFALCLALELRWATAGRAATVVTLGAFLAWAGAYSGNSDLLFLLAAPVLLAGAALGLPTAFLAAFVGSIWIIGSSGWTGPTLDWSTASVAVALLWIAFGALLLGYQPVYEFAGWTWRYYDRTQRQLAEAEERKLTLEQVTAELSHINEQLTRMNVLARRLQLAAEEARTAKQQFVANVSHELRTPLNMIIGFSEMILDAPEAYGERVPTALLADLAVIRRNASHLSELVNDVLDLSQIEADQMILQREYVAFDEILAAAVIGVRPLYHSKGLYLHTDVGEGLPPIFCDATRVREVLLNLLSNAGRYTDAGGVTIRAQRAGEQLVVAVEDTGRGISPQDLGRLFQPFSQLDASLSRRNGGAGLGLSISKQFIELHEGRMWVESEVGKGTTFYFQLPITAPGPLEETAARWIEEDWEFVERPARPRITPPKLRPRYLVYDANGALLSLLARSLPSAEIVPVADIAATYDAPAEEMGDLVLVNDVSISAGLTRLNAPDGPPLLPALVCAISSPDEDPDTQGATARLVKPISRETLLTTLADAGVSSGMVLIVDDEPDALQLFSRLLTSAAPAYRVLVAGTGQEALHILRDYRPDAILLDLVMPDIDGYELLAKLQNDPTLSAAPVIIISARDPATYPLISDGLAIAYPEGVSARRVMATIEFTNQLFAPEPSRAPTSPISPPGSPAS